MTISILIGSYFNRPSSTSEDALIFHKRDLLKPWTRRVRLSGRISMGHCSKQNDFTWRKMKQTVCIIAQFKSAITNNFKVSVTGGNMWIRSTIGSFSSSKRQFLKPRQFVWTLPKRNLWRTQLTIHRVRGAKCITKQVEHFPHFQSLVKLAKHSKSDWLEVASVTEKIGKCNRSWRDALNFSSFAARTRTT